MSQGAHAAVFRCFLVVASCSLFVFFLFMWVVNSSSWAVPASGLGEKSLQRRSALILSCEL